MKGIQRGMVLAGMGLLATALCAYAQKERPAEALYQSSYQAGEHNGEVKQLEVNVGFGGEYGQTVTDAQGTTYNVWGMSFYEQKVYPPEYWGVFPLYFYDTDVGVTITVKNVGPRKIAKLRVRTECYVLQTDGSNGTQLGQPRESDIDVEAGETAAVDATFNVSYTPGADSGLDRLVVKILHPNEGGGPGNPDPALIMVKEGIFCPPEYQGELMEILNEVINP